MNMKTKIREYRTKFFFIFTYREISVIEEIIHKRDKVAIDLRHFLVIIVIQHILIKNIILKRRLFNFNIIKLV